MGRPLALCILVLAGSLVLPAASSAALRAGVAEVDASWHVGAGAGQYASTGSFVDPDGFDPSVHSYHFKRSYGLQSRLKVRAIVIEGPDGTRTAIVKQDLYLPQDLLYRRTAQLLEQGDSGITRETLSMVATHNHSSPYYSSPSWGVWTFQDFFDVRFYNYYAERLAEAVERAAENLVPATVGGAVRQLPDLHRNVPGPGTADDGTPAGFPHDYGDHDVTVVRFDDVSDPRRPKPLANLVNYAIHPEMLEGNDLISADWLGPFQRITDRETGAMTIYTQGAVGNHEPEESRFHEPSEGREYYHRDYAQTERAARDLANVVIATSGDVARRRAGSGGDPQRLVRPDASPKVEMIDRWFPGPISHPVPTVAGCRTEKAVEGDPRIPVANECTGAEHNAFDPGVTTDTLKDAGIPVPDNLSVPAYTGLEEDLNVHLQALRIGDILFTLCSCEQWADQSRNIETRTNLTQGDEWVGYVWDCEPDGENITEAECARARAQVLNDAKGWEDDPTAESEPTDPAKIKGNYTHGELPPEHAYRLTVPIGMANDYNGYIVTYREYQRGDHYRKSLTAWGPHASDYMATRLVKLGGQLKGAEPPPTEPLEPKIAPDLAHNDARAEVLGTAGKAALESYEATLPNDSDGGTVVEQPQEVLTRFDAATFTWNGGSNYIDLPEVRVQRKVRGEWVDYADQSGEVPLTLQFPQAQNAATYLGGQQWPWTAHFEAFVSDIDAGGGRATPAGTYRFSVQGVYRDSMGRKDYSLTSNEFQVEPWDGITVEDLRKEADGRLSFRVGPRRAWTVPAAGGAPEVSGETGPIDYPDSYEVSRQAAFIGENRTAMRDRSDPTRITWYCFTCSFRPWLNAGDATRAFVTIVSATGRKQRVPARESAGRWYTERALAQGETAFVAAGHVRDEWGNYNGEAAHFSN